MSNNPEKFVVNIVGHNTRCPVCGAINEFDATSCRNCHTIFPHGISHSEMEVKVNEKNNVKPKTFKIKKLRETVSVPKSKAEIINEFMLIPGITREKAEKVYDMGIRSLSELFYNVIYDNVEQPEYKCKVLEDRVLFEKKGVGATVTCPVCKTVFPINYERCKVCGASLEEDILKISENRVMDDAMFFVNKLVESTVDDEKISLHVDDIESVNAGNSAVDLNAIIEKINKADNVKNENSAEVMPAEEATTEKPVDESEPAEGEYEDNAESMNYTGVEHREMEHTGHVEVDKEELRKYVERKVNSFTEEVDKSLQDVKKIGGGFNSYLKLLYVYQKLGFDILPLYRILRKNIPLFEDSFTSMIVTQYRKKLENVILQ